MNANMQRASVINYLSARERQLGHDFVLCFDSGIMTYRYSCTQRLCSLKCFISIVQWLGLPILIGRLIFFRIIVCLITLSPVAAAKTSGKGTLIPPKWAFWINSEHCTITMLFLIDEQMFQSPNEGGIIFFNEIWNRFEFSNIVVTREMDYVQLKS